MKKHLNVLLVDDDEDERILFTDTVNQIEADVDITNATNSSEMMWLISREDALPPDIIFLDLSMHSENGMHCLDEIRSNPKLENTPVIIYSNSVSVKDLTETYEKGANLYVKKPSDVNDQKMVFKKVFSLNWSEHQPHPVKQKFFLSARTLEQI